MHIKIKPIKLGILLMTALLYTGCEKEGYNYNKYLQGQEIIYSGKVANLSTQPGDLRMQLSWTPSSDRSIVRYVIYYNNSRDSVNVKANNESTFDTIKAIVPKLNEYPQDFTLYTVDSIGNRSIGQILTAVKVYGPVYQSTLRNRQVSFDSFDGDGKLVINLSTAVDTINVTTKITYKNINNSITNLFAASDSNRIVLPNWKKGENVMVCSGYFPEKNAIDTFWVAYTDTLLGHDIPAQ